MSNLSLVDNQTKWKLLLDDHRHNDDDDHHHMTTENVENEQLCQNKSYLQSFIALNDFFFTILERKKVESFVKPVENVPQH